MPQSVYPGLSAKGGRFTFGRAGVVSLPSRAATPTIGGSFVAQGSPIPVRQAGYQSISLTPKKMGVISTFTREIAEHSTPSIEALIRQAIQEDTSVAIDAVLLDNTAASTTRPAGLRNGVSGLTPTTGGGFAALVGDIKQMVAVLVAANSLRAPVWIMNPAQVLSIAMTQNAGGDFPFAAEVNQGRLQGYPISAVDQHGRSACSSR
jgi:HK97 family phage major capsid protein